MKLVAGGNGWKRQFFAPRIKKLGLCATNSR
jgi:hypothetical protein